MDQNYIAPAAALKKLKKARSIPQTVYLYGATGYGKTELVRQYLSGRKYIYLSCEELPWEAGALPSAEPGRQNRRVVVIDDLHRLKSEELRQEILALEKRKDSLSPVAIGYQAVTTPNPQPNPGGSSGGGGSASTYAITVEKSEHGKVTSNRTNASSNSTVTLTVTPDSGYVLDTLTVTDSRGNEIRLTAQSGGKYTFTMPGRAVTVKASFVPLPDDTQKPCDGGADCPSRGFTDLGGVGTWYHEAVDYVLRNGLMGGYGNGTFGPNNNLTRAQFAQILFNREGRPVVNYLLQYGDVASGAW